MVLPKTGTFLEERRNGFTIKPPRTVVRTYFHLQLIASWQCLLAGCRYLPELNVVLFSLTSSFALSILIFSSFLMLQSHLPCGLKLLSIDFFFFSIFTSDLFHGKNFHTREFPLHLHLIYPFKDMMSSFTDPLQGSCKVTPLFSLRHIIGAKQVFIN